jgi:uncharacterized protein (DUF2252 family)
LESLAVLGYVNHSSIQGREQMNKHTQAPGTSGIKRDTKRANRAKKKAQYLANQQARAEANRSGPSKPRK